MSANSVLNTPINPSRQFIDPYADTNFDDLKFDAPEHSMSLDMPLYRASNTMQDRPGIEIVNMDGRGQGDERIHCGQLPIQGYLVGVEVREDPDSKYDKKTIQLLQVRLTRPCVGINNGELVRVKSGDYLKITVVGALSSLVEVARNPTHMVEVYLRPTSELLAMPKDGNKPLNPMRVWDRRVIGAPVLRRSLPKNNDAARQLVEAQVPHEDSF